MTQRFFKATDALYNAFFNGTLGKGSCTACAVGNIVCDAMGGKIYKTEVNHFGEVIIDFNSTTGNDFWSNLFSTYDGVQETPYKYILSTNNKGYQVMEKLYDLTGYTADEMAKVEYAFETNTRIYFTNYGDYTEQEILEDQYNGLCAVFDVLMQLDEVQDSQYKEKLQTHPKLQLV